jgi:magnesium transporter
VDTFTSSINAIERKTEAIEDLILVGRTEDSAVLLQGIAKCCRIVTTLIQLLSGTANTINDLSKYYGELHYGVQQEAEFRVYLSDIQDHIKTMMSGLGDLERMLTHSHANHLMQLGANSVENGNGVKHALGVISLVATVFAALNVICSLFGVNVRVPGKDPRGIHWFFAIIGVFAAIVVLCLILARRMKYV